MPDDEWDFEVQRVEMSGLGIDASHKLGMVIVQPEYQPVPDGTVPFQLHQDCRKSQEELIKKAFEIRAAEAEAREPIPFVLFPEMAIPVEALDKIDDEMSKIAGEAIFIGGLEGLNPENAHAIAAKFTKGNDIGKPDFDGAGTFVNMCVIVIKQKEKPLSWYFQAKLRPSQWEESRNMALGKRVLYFVARQLHFLCQICFDHIAKQGEDSISTVLLHKIVGAAQMDAASIDFVFVTQYNPKWNHDSVKENTERMLTFANTKLSNALMSVVVVNKASKDQESPEYGRSGFHFKGGRWPVAKRDVGPKGYELFDSGKVTSAVFRKRTQAIHVATIIPGGDNVGDTENPSKPLVNPRSYLITDKCDPAPCSCLSETEVFVECDCLPCKLRDTLRETLWHTDSKGRWHNPKNGQGQLLEQYYLKLRKAMLMLQAARAREIVSLLLQAHKSEEKENPDLWSNSQLEAVIELVSALSVLETLEPVNLLAEAPQLTALLGESLAVAVLDGDDKRHHRPAIEKEYVTHFGPQYHRSGAFRKKVLIVALRSRGDLDPPVQAVSKEFSELIYPDRLGNQTDYTKPIRPTFYVCQDRLFEGAREANDMRSYLKNRMECLFEH